MWKFIISSLLHPFCWLSMLILSVNLIKHHIFEAITWSIDSCVDCCISCKKHRKPCICIHKMFNCMFSLQIKLEFKRLNWHISLCQHWKLRHILTILLYLWTSVLFSFQLVCLIFDSTAEDLVHTVQITILQDFKITSYWYAYSH